MCVWLQIFSDSDRREGGGDERIIDFPVGESWAGGMRLETLQSLTTTTYTPVRVYECMLGRNYRVFG